MSSDFYRAFEDKHRGSRELIMGRLNVYLPFAEILKQMYPHAGAVDLGCGRGEWLGLLEEIGVSAHGVDLDDGMLEVCRDLGLLHSKGDAVTYLKGLPDESQIIVSGFHLVEHLPFAELQALVQEALRVLRPAGLLILETPNPENFSVGTTSFYLDPSHERPIPPELLSFLPEHYGYYRTKVLRLQESPDLVLNQSPALLSLLNGVSPDYAIVSQKGAAPDMLALFDELFARDYGLSLETLAMRYESNINQNFIQSLQFAQHIVERTEAKLQASLQRIVQVEEELVAARIYAVQVDSSSAESRDYATRLEAVLAESRAHVAQVESSLDASRVYAAHVESELDASRVYAAHIESELDASRVYAAHVESELDASCVYAAQVESGLDASRAHAAQIESSLTESHAQAQWLENEWNAAKAKVEELNHNCHHWWTVADGLDRELKSVCGSRSWRYTRPLRVFGHILRRGHAAVCSVPYAMKQGIKSLIKPVLTRGVRFVMVRPVLKTKALNQLRKYPEIEARLRRFAAARGLTTGFGFYPLPPLGINSHSESGDLAHLSPRARKIYQELNAAIEKNRGGY